MELDLKNGAEGVVAAGGAAVGILGWLWTVASKVSRMDSKIEEHEREIVALKAADAKFSDKLDEVLKATYRIEGAISGKPMSN